VKRRHRRIAKEKRTMQAYLTRALAALRLWLLIGAALAGVHRLGDGDWSGAPGSLAWAALATVIVLVSRRWHAARGAVCPMCVPAAESEPPRTGRHDA
jgi:hypothetical protein